MSLLMVVRGWFCHLWVESCVSANLDVVSCRIGLPKTRQKLCCVVSYLTPLVSCHVVSFSHYKKVLVLTTQEKKNKSLSGGHISVKSQSILKNYMRFGITISYNLRLCTTLQLYSLGSYDQKYEFLYSPEIRTW